ncbi:response regulator [Lachnospiraceae bacterium MD1]|jgi:two-component system response regulator YesN|uniref:Stage 0 sporulation protein A homolog n=1 Tax=Variimorphobacter saccharofermentans TaxID=2755051 RepID=A0A839JZ76_9FIRM|nr:response regulator [Variimorphobacter saccharofermentans]MBB2182676.1 response regulator [Variimorphobacter saccharofermentans]
MYKVLIVEPQEFALKALLNLPIWGIGEDGFVCTETATNGEEALTLLQTKEFDLVLTEINLSIFDGLQLLKQVYKDNEPPLIVFISDIVSFTYAREGFIYGAFDYLPKPLNRETMLALFQRATEKLEKQKKHLSIRSDASMEHRTFLAKGQIQALINRFTHKDETVPEMFRNMMMTIYHSKTSSQPSDILANKLFVTITVGIFEKHDWLPLYLPQNFHKQFDYPVLHDSNDFIEYYMRKFTCLFQLFCQLNPDFQDETLIKIHQYILQHPEEDLKLTMIASKFYMNHSYLSNLFSKKSSIHYSQLVTIVKMKRAEYLLNYTVLPVIDIAYRLGYKDIHYFTQIYKKTIGKSPTEYNREAYYYSEYTI